MANHFRTAARPSITAELWLPEDLFFRFCPCQRQYLERTHQLFDEIAEVAYAAGDFDIARAHQVSELEWEFAQDDYFDGSGLTPKQICAVLRCDWPTAVELSFLPSVSRLRMLCVRGIVPWHPYDAHVCEERRDFVPMS